jgi:hypothetical protein
MRRGRRRALLERRLSAEILEDRWLLSLTNAAINESQKDILSDGLMGLAGWADLLDEHDLASQVLPAIGQSAGEAVDFGDILNQGLAERISDYFASDADPTTDELVTALQGLNAATFDNVTLAIANVSGGHDTDAGANELVFHLEFGATRSIVANASLGPEGDALGIAFSPMVPATAELTFNFSFGCDLASGLSDEQAFFIRVGKLTFEIDANVGAVASGPMSIGFYGATLSSGNMALNADLVVYLTNPD